MAIKRKRKPDENPKLEMTPMIDVVFQLLIFFIVTLKQEDILSQLLANRPAPDKSTSESPPDVPLITIDVYNGGFLFNKAGVSYKELDNNLKKLSGYSKDSSVIIRCMNDSPHKYLVQALDLCNKHGMKNLSIFSL